LGNGLKLLAIWSGVTFEPQAADAEGEALIAKVGAGDPSSDGKVNLKKRPAGNPTGRKSFKKDR
jgi:hypothetical protein